MPPSVTSIAASVYKSTQWSKGSLDIIPSTLDLMYLALGQSDVKIKPMEERFEKFINECRAIYELIVIDCHPAGSLFTKTSLRNSDHVLIPVVPESQYALRGIGLMMNFIKAKKAGEKSPAPHVLLNMTPRFGTTERERRMRANPELVGLCMDRSSKRYKVFSEPEGGRHFVWQSGKPYSTEALGNLMKVAREVLSRIGV